MHHERSVLQQLPSSKYTLPNIFPNTTPLSKFFISAFSLVMCEIHIRSFAFKDISDLIFLSAFKAAHILIPLCINGSPIFPQFEYLITIFIGLHISTQSNFDHLLSEIRFYIIFISDEMFADFYPTLSIPSLISPRGGNDTKTFSAPAK